MTLLEARINVGRKAIYRPPHGAPLEEGVITSVSNTYVFVRYGSEAWSKATCPDDLSLLSEPITDG
jgi:hypothetical protein